MSTATESLVSMPCQLPPCKFHAYCAVNAGFSLTQAREACRTILREHWCLEHSTLQDRAMMLQELGLREKRPSKKESKRKP